jgi:DDE superfamily endonuclease
LLDPFRIAFTAPGWRRFVEWITGLALNVEEHTITQSLLALDRPQDWKSLETFAEIGSWDSPLLDVALTRQIDSAPGSLWYGYRVWACDDTKVHRSSTAVWGVCTFHEYTARCPNRATTVRAHNWVVLGRLLANGSQPAWFLPQTGRLYCRQSQLPTSLEPFRTKCELAVELFRQQATALSGRHLAIFDGGFAFRSVVRPLVLPEPGQPRIEFLTRLRQDARLYRLPPAEKPAGRPGPRPCWGRRLSPPRQGGRWPGAWRSDRAFIYGRQRQVRWKEVRCLWRVLGHEAPVTAVVAEVEGYRKRFHLVSSAVDLSGLQLVELFAARFRQEDGFRDLKQRLGWEEGRAWTKTPLQRTTTALFVTMSLLRLLQFRLEQSDVSEWWTAPPWDRHKNRPSVRDVQRLLWRCRTTMQAGVSELLGDGGNATKEEGETKGM